MKRKIHPIRGAIGGLLVGLGVAVLLIIYGKVWFGRASVWIPLPIFLALGVLLGLVGPTRPGSRGAGGPT